MRSTLLDTSVAVKVGVGSGGRPWPPGDSTEPDGDELADFGAIDGILDVMPTEPAPPPSWRGRLADRIEIVGCQVAVRAWDLAAAIREF